MLILGILWWVFLILVVLGIAIISAVEEEKPAFGFIALIIAGAVIHYSGTFDLMNVVKEWPFYLTRFFEYVGIGVGWCVVKWFFYTNAWGREQKERIQAARKEFLQRLGITGDSVPQEHKSAWELWRQQTRQAYDRDWQGFYEDKLKQPPSTPVASADDIHVKNNWKKFGVWAMYWPFSMIWTLLDDPIKRLFKFIIVNVLGGTLQSFANRAVAGVESEANK